MYKKTFRFMIPLFLFVLNIFAADHEISTDHLWTLLSKESSERAFALNGTQIQIKIPKTKLQAAWAGHNITPSANVIVFKAKALNGKNINFKINITMTAYHGDPAEKCMGHSETKSFVFKNHAQENLKVFSVPLTIDASDLVCQQCGNPTNHATFIFDFTTEDSGGIEISPFQLKTEFIIRLQKKTDSQAPYLSNILAPEYKPYEMKELPAHTTYTQDFTEMSRKANITRKNYEEFLPVLEFLKKEDYKNAIVLAEKNADENIFSSVMLYLIYSRGYCGENSNYSKAAKYFNNLIGSYFGKEPGYMFWVYEYVNIWKKYRLTPNTPGETAEIKTWDATGMIMDEIVPLRGKYPLKKCYEERMRNIGGIGARTLYLIAREQLVLDSILDEARNLGNAEAWAGNHAPFEQRGMNPERPPLSQEGTINKPDESEYKNLKRAAELGYVPAKLRLARVLLTKNFSPEGFDLSGARKLLEDSIKECEKYSGTCCKHAETDLKYARDLLDVIPEKNTPVQELINRYDQLQAKKWYVQDSSFLQFRMDILAEMISKMDHPDSLFFQALELPSTEYNKKNQLFRSAAEKGSQKAIKMCLDGIYRHGHKDRWYFLYLAGKFQTPYNGNKQNYFNEAYCTLQEMRYQIPPPEYFNILSVLAPHHKQAEEEYRKLSKELVFDISISDKRSLSAEKRNDGGFHSVEIKAQPSTVTRYVVIKNRSAEKIRGEIFLYSLSKQCSNLDVSGEFTDENGKTQRTYPGNVLLMKYLPAELKITIAPRTESLDLQVQYRIY